MVCLNDYILTIAFFKGKFGDIEERRSLVLLSPLLALVTFGLYSVAVIVYRSVTI
jgi:hypothetical protein